MEGKECRACRQWKSNEELKREKKKNGEYTYKNICKACNSEYLRKYRQENAEAIQEKEKIRSEQRREYIKENSRRWYKENREEKLEYKKQYYLENKETCLERTRQFHEKNPEYKGIYNKQYREENREALLQYDKERYTSPKRREQVKRYGRSEKTKLRRRLYRQSERGKALDYQYQLKRRSYKHQVIFTEVERKEIIDRDKWKCRECKRKVHDDRKRPFAPDKANIDHIIPISKGGNSEPSNLQTLCRECNLKKGNKIELQLSLF